MDVAGVPCRSRTRQGPFASAGWTKKWASHTRARGRRECPVRPGIQARVVAGGGDPAPQMVPGLAQSPGHVVTEEESQAGRGHGVLFGWKRRQFLGGPDPACAVGRWGAVRDRAEHPQIPLASLRLPEELERLGRASLSHSSFCLSICLSVSGRALAWPQGVCSPLGGLPRFSVRAR